jgi:hypothetical protein
MTSFASERREVCASVPPRAAAEVREERLVGGAPPANPYPYPYDLTAEFSDGTRVEHGSVTPKVYVARSGSGKITWHPSLKDAERAAGKRGEVAPVTASSEAYEAWLISKGIPEEAIRPPEHRPALTCSGLLLLNHRNAWYRASAT